MSDDIDAPHYKEIFISPNWKIKTILVNIMKCNYLPSIAGGKATWSMAINEPIAVITQENPESFKLICLPDYPFQGTSGFVDIQNIHFNYHAQKSSQDVFEVLLRFRIRPEKRIVKLRYCGKNWLWKITHSFKSSLVKRMISETITIDLI